MANRTALTIILSIILTILIISVANVGMQLVYESPDYTDFCGDYRYPLVVGENASETICSEDTKVCDDGTIVSRNPKMNCEFPSCKSEYDTCNAEYNAASENYNQIRFYIFAVLGVIFLLGALYVKENLFQYTGLASGAILILEGVVINLQNKLVVFIALLLILIVFGYLGYRAISKKK